MVPLYSHSRALQAQLKELMDDPPPGVNAGPEEDDLMQWTGMIAGPVGEGLNWAGELWPV